MHDFFRHLPARAAVVGAALAALSLMPPALVAAELKPLEPTPKMAQETITAVYCLERGHYLQKPFAEFDQRDLLKSYLGNLDPLHQFMYESDLKAFQDAYASTLAQNVQQFGNLTPAFEIYRKYRDRVNERVTWIFQRLDGDFDLATAETYQPDRTELPWPADKAAADQLWEQQLRFELINEILALETREITAANKKQAAAGKAQPGTASASTAAPDSAATAPANTATATAATETKPADAKAAEDAQPKTREEKIAAAKAELRKRYTTYLRLRNETESVEVQEAFLNTIANRYDPHSSFLSQYYLEEFDIMMRNALVGIGAMLSDNDGYCTIREFVPSGPAEKSGQLHAGDKIVGVGQGPDGDIVDVVGVKLRKTVNLIRGAEGSQVRLQIVPVGDPGSKKVVTLTREEIKITTKLAKASIIEVPAGDKTIPVGVIDLPTFYGKGGGGDNFSTTEDVRELLGKLKDAHVQGVVLDLRRNGGGFLNEAIDLTGLFIPTGAVLQVRDTANSLNQLLDRDPAVAWDGPLLLLTSKLSASATEILAGALQDYRRAVIVGDTATHGKGTVQAVFQLDRLNALTKGAAKVTIQKWYLPDGNSIQAKGVAADIVLPSVIASLPIGESDQKFALEWDSVKPLELKLNGTGAWRDALLDDALLARLRDNSAARQNSLEEFVFLKDRVTWEKTRQDQKDYSLNLDSRLAQRRDDILYRDKTKAQLEALAAGNFKAAEMLLEAAKAQEAAQKDKPKEPDLSALNSPRLDGPRSPDEEDEDAEPEVVFDIQLRESLRIMADWIQLLHDREKLSAPPAQLVAQGGAGAPAATTAGTATAATPTSVAPATPSPIQVTP